MNGDGNLVTDNSIVNAATGVRVGTLQPPSQTLGTDNRITSNGQGGISAAREAALDRVSAHRQKRAGNRRKDII